MKSIVNGLADVIFPRVCHICNRSLASHEMFVCTGCYSDLPRSGYHRRYMNPMEERIAGLFPFERATGFFLYSRRSPLSVLVQDMKYRGYPGIGKFLGQKVAEELFATGFFSDASLVVPMPMYWLKKARRGYNQAEYMACGVAEGAMMETCFALKATRSHKTQTAMSREGRLDNVSDMFKVIKPDQIKGKHVVLVDDICTTGATIASAATALWDASPSALTILTLGVTF